MAALLALRDQVIAPILAGIRSPRMGRKPPHWTRIDRDYEIMPTSALCRSREGNRCSARVTALELSA